MPTVQEYRQRLSALTNDRSTWIDHWRDIADHTIPRRARFNLSDRNRGTKRNAKIINGTGTKALRTLAAGMMAGLTSPSRPWFRLTTPNPDLMELYHVRTWLDDSERRMREVFARSNTYNSLHSLYLDLGGFGVSPLHIEEDLEDVIRGYVFPIGSYCLAASPRQSIDTIYRELKMTVGQLVEKFGRDACSIGVRNAYDAKRLDESIDVCHVIEPNREWQPGRADRYGKRFVSAWFEKGTSPDDKPLLLSGYEEQPFMAPRWDVTGEDVYGSSPAMDALGDVRQLQVMEKRKLQALEKIVDPPMSAPAALKNQGGVSILPGAVNWVDDGARGAKVEPAQIVDTRVLAMDRAIEVVEQRIQQAFYADLFLGITMLEHGQITAEEIRARNEEKLIQLGPVLERIHDELLDPLIDRTFAIMARNGLLAPPPEELEGEDLRVEYISFLAQAQKGLGVASIERLAGYVKGIAETQPSAWDKFDIDQSIDEMAERLGAPARVIRSDDAVAELREAQAAAQKQAAALEQAKAAEASARAAKALSETNVDQDSALTRLIDPALVGGGEAAA